MKKLSKTFVTTMISLFLISVLSIFLGEAFIVGTVIMALFSFVIGVIFIILIMFVLLFVVAAVIVLILKTIGWIRELFAKINLRKWFLPYIFAVIND